MKNSASRSRRRALSQALPSLAIGLCAIMASSAAPIAGAQTTGPATRLIVGYPAGGPVDGAARLIAPALASASSAARWS